MSRGRTRAWTPSQPLPGTAGGGHGGTPVQGGTGAPAAASNPEISHAATQFDMRAPGPAPGTTPAQLPYGASPPAGVPAVPATASHPVVPDPRLAGPSGIYPGMELEGRYRVARKIGAGGMGQVWEAFHTVIRKPVALKVLQIGDSVKPQEAERLLREARATAQISHPNVIDITDFGHAPDGSPYFVMERLLGRTLKDVIKQEGALEWRRAVAILRQLAAALQAAHAKGVIHRDLKPENVFLVQPTAASTVSGDVVKVIDFGIAKVTNLDPNARSFTKTGMVCGTPAFMSPEQARGDKVDLRTDIYALGCVGYQMMTAALPFDGDTSTEVLYKQLFSEPSPMIEVAPHAIVPADVEAFVFRCLRKDPALRFQHGAEVFEALDRLGTGQAPVDVPRERHEPPAAAAEAFARAAQYTGAPESTMPQEPDATLPSLELPTTMADARGPGGDTARRRKDGAPVGAIVAAVVGVVALAGAVTVFSLRPDLVFGGGAEPPGEDGAAGAAGQAGQAGDDAAAVTADAVAAEVTATETDGAGEAASEADEAGDAEDADEAGEADDPGDGVAANRGDAQAAGKPRAQRGKSGPSGKTRSKSDPPKPPHTDTSALPAPPLPSAVDEPEEPAATPEPKAPEPAPKPEPEPKKKASNRPDDLRNPWE